MVTTLLLLGGCRAATLAYGPDAATAKTNADALASALEQRFTNVVRQPKFLNARMRIARYALSPSKLVNDTALWTDMRTERTGAERSIEVAATVVNGQYVFSPRAHAAPPSRLGDSRHVIALNKLAQDGDWQWTTTVDQAIGPLPPPRAADILRALFASAERPASATRADYSSAFPKTSEAFGRLIALDTLLTATQIDGSTLVTMHFFTSDERIKATFPAFAKFVRKYVTPTKYHFRLSDHAGNDFFDAQSTKARLVVRFRSRNGVLQPLSGLARPMPDSLQLHIDGSAKFGMFTVGASKLVGDFVIVSSPTERSWRMRFTKEPEWDLPLLAEQLLNTPLQRPFDGDGVQFRIGFVSAGNNQTLLTRTLRLAVRESAIMRFLGNLGFTAMSDYAGKAEEEQDRFFAEAFSAMRADIATLGTAGGK